MWYAMQVGNGLEENICSHCERELSARVSCHCFVPHYETQMKLQGQWRTVQRILLTG
ncbi:MAG: hypothetical protein LUC32_05885 [Clostridiales bacterium]|nr:hypothetical protein [Clostridiales bacterium]